MLVAYLDEVAEAGAFVSKTHKNYNGSPAFGYAGFEDASFAGYRRKRGALDGVSWV